MLKPVPDMTLPRIACTYEDRVSSLPGLRLLAASLARHAPSLSLVIHTPELELIHALTGSLPPQASVQEWNGARDGWNAKPKVLLHEITKAAGPVLWLDADLIVAGPMLPFFNQFAPEALLLAPEPYWFADNSGQSRTVGWSMRDVRQLPRVLNTCIIRAGPQHVPLLERWGELLTRPAYTAAQLQPVLERARHLVGDQDVLTALLGSEEGAKYHIETLRLGRDIVHCYDTLGHRPIERMREWLAGAPTFVHAQGDKPWRASAKPGHSTGWRGEIYSSFQELSRYTMEATKYADSLRDDVDWLHIRTQLARTLTTLHAGRKGAASLTLASVFSLVHWIRAIVKVRFVNVPRHTV